MTDNANQDFKRFLRSASMSMEADEVLRSSPIILIGVSPAVEAALAKIQINSIFDLASSSVFAAASAITAIGQDPTTVEARLNIIASDLAILPPGIPVRELADQPICILRAIGDSIAPSISEELAVSTVRDLAYWPPYQAAKTILDIAFFPEKTQGFDAEAPADLLPKSGVYPTERIFFKKLVIDIGAESPNGTHPIETSSPIDLTAALAAPAGFNHLAFGALLTFSQSWTMLGVTLGSLLHSVSLAPGESTRMAFQDWSRRSKAAASEDISEDELLSNTMSHSRALSEVTNATASEFQTGSAHTHVDTDTNQEGGALGFDLSSLGIPVAGGASGGRSNTTTDVMSTSSSFGARDLAASYAQKINDLSQQNASSVRNRRASIVREVSQSEHDQISTRVITNYNHMYALNVQCFEVVQVCNVKTQLERAERCLFVPVKLLNFRDPSVIDRWRLVLAANALSERTRRQLTAEYGVVEIIPQTPPIRPGGIIVGPRPVGILSANVLASRNSTRTTALSSTSSTPSEISTGGSSTSQTNGESTASNSLGPVLDTNTIDYQRAPLNSPAALLALKGWDIEQLNRIAWATGRVMMQAGSDSVFVSDDSLVVGLSLREGQATRFVIRLHTGQEVIPAATTETTFSFYAPVAITDLESVAVQFNGQQVLKTVLVLQLNLSGTIMPLDIPIVLQPTSAPREVVKFGGVAPQKELMNELQANCYHYSQAVFRTLDTATVAQLLAPYTYRGLPLSQLVDNQPIAITANFFVFKMNVSTSGEPDDPRWAEEQKAWKIWLERHGLDNPVPKTEIIPIPSGGVFAEAVLGRSNAAEKLDLSRFWNWQDSPIPLTAPDIAPLQAGSRAQSDQITPGQLSAPVLGIQSPTALPDPTGIAAILGAIQNGNMFRDMSGLAQQAALAQAALQASTSGATAVGEQAAQNMKTFMDNETERLRIAAEALTGTPISSGGSSTGSRPAKNVTEEGARLGYARGLDANGSSNGSGNGRSKNSGGAQDGSNDGSQESVERSLFRRQTGDTNTNLSSKPSVNKRLKNYHLQMTIQDPAGKGFDGTWVLNFGSLEAEGFETTTNSNTIDFDVKLDPSIDNKFELKGNPLLLGRSFPPGHEYYYHVLKFSPVVDKNPNITLTVSQMIGKRTVMYAKTDSLEQRKTKAVAQESGTQSEISGESGGLEELVMGKVAGSITFFGKETETTSNETASGSSTTDSMSDTVDMLRSRLTVKQKGQPQEKLDIQD